MKPTKIAYLEQLTTNKALNGYSDVAYSGFFPLSFILVIFYNNLTVRKIFIIANKLQV